MPKFSYVVKDTSGKSFKNTIDALDQTAVVEKLQKQGYFVVSVKELTSLAQLQKPSGIKTKRYTHSKVKLNDLLTFSRQLATMLESGLAAVASETGRAVTNASRRIAGRACWA